MAGFTARLRRADGSAAPDPEGLARHLLAAWSEPEAGRLTSAAVWCVVEAMHEATAFVLDIAQDPDRGSMTRLDPWVKILSPLVNPDEPAEPRLRLLTRLLALDAATWLLADAESPGTSQEIRLAQLSLDLDHHFAKASLTPDDKVAGSELHRFGGFLKRSWRLNDWIWGRLDAAQMLCRLVLDPQRLLRIHALTGQSAEELVEQLVAASYAGGAAPDDERFGDLRKAATDELRRLFDHDATVADHGFLRDLARLAAHPVQQQIVVEELPALAAAIRADEVAGASVRSHGRRFLSRHEPRESCCPGSPQPGPTAGSGSATRRWRRSTRPASVVSRWSPRPAATR